MKKFYDCGIDLGTTNSCIAVPKEDGTCSIIESTTAPMQVTQSAVWVSKTGHITVGRKAYYCTNVGEVKKEFKRDMGTDTVYTFKGSEKQFTPEELSAEVLKVLRSDAFKRTNKEMNDAIITVPAAFSMIQCEATKRAACLAGFRNCILLQEPIAAAIAYGAQPNAGDQYWLVFDYGGGTLDVSIISTVDGRLENINCRGNNHMGGKDIDRILYEKIILPKIQSQYDLEHGFDEGTTAKILIDVESCKIELSTQDVVQFELFDLEDDSGEYIEFSCSIARSEFDEIIESTVDSAIMIAKETLLESGINEHNLVKIVLVGGTTFIPLVREKLQETFNAPLDCTENPMIVVAKGAGMYAAMNTVDDFKEKIDVQNDCYVEIEYSPITASETTNICGKITNSQNNDVTQVCVDCIASELSESSLWSSGWINLLDVEAGVFDVDIKICNLESKNTFRISARTSDGTPCKLKGYLFEILHKSNSLTAAAPPMPFNMGIMVTDGKTNYIDWLIKKNTKLPAEVTHEYILNKTLSPGSDDECIVRIVEGEEENTYNPDANTLLRIIRIKGKDRTFDKGTDVELSIKIDESRCLHIACFVPAYNCELLSQEITDELEVKKNYMHVMDALDLKLKETKYTLDSLKNKGVDIQGCISEYRGIVDDYDKYYDLIDKDNDQVDIYIKRFFSFQTKVILLERDTSEDVEKKSNSDSVMQYESNVSKYGSLENKKEFEKLKLQYSVAKDPGSQKYLINKMEALDNSILNSSFPWIESIFYWMDGNYIAYTDNQKADYWKDEARKAINNHDFDALKTAVIRLQNLRLKSASETVSNELADLRKK